LEFLILLSDLLKLKAKHGGSKMTEKEAREKWCPMAKVAFIDMDMDMDFVVIKELPSANRIQDRKSEEYGIVEGASCIGSDCALWQWNGYSDSPRDRKGHCGLVKR